jgi:hypothetical protein
MAAPKPSHPIATEPRKKLTQVGYHVLIAYFCDQGVDHVEITEEASDPDAAESLARLALDDQVGERGQTHVKVASVRVTRT